jgi:ABC-type branched-subunit amino acid transport system substrate-binding protein
MRPKSGTFLWTSTVAAVGLCATLAACSSSGGGSASSTSSANDDSSSTVKVMVIGSFTAGTAAAAPNVFPTPQYGVKAAANAMNAAGGMNGHRVDVIACDDQGNPNLAATCARQAQSDGVVAVVGSFDPVGTAQTLPILNAEGIPYLGATSAEPTDYTSPNAWPMDGGGAVAAYGLIADLVDNKCSSVTFLAPDTPLSDASWASAKTSFTAAGIKYSSNYVTFTQGGVDLAPNVSQALSQNSECLWISSIPSDGVKLVQLIRGDNASVKIFAAYQSVGPAALSGLGAAGNGINVVSATPLPSTNTSAMQEFKKQMAASGYAQDEDAFAVTAWAGMQLLELATKGMANPTAAALTAKLPTMSNFTVGGYPSVSFTKPFDNASYPRMFNRKVEYYVTKDGQFQPVGSGARDVTQFINAG